MDFELSPSHNELYDNVLRFARGQLNDNVHARDHEQRFPRREWDLCGDFGLLGLCIDKEFGGMGQGHLGTAVGLEALGRGCEDMGLVFAICAHQLAVAKPIEEGASDVLKKRVLPRFCSGEWIGANAITEAGAGSDVFALASRAEHDDGKGRYIVTGTKSYVSNGPVADAFLFYANAKPELGYLGIEAFVVEREAPGVTVGAPIPKMGLHTCPASTLYLSDVEISEADRVGPAGGGAKLFTQSMLWERSCLFAGYLGSMERQLELCVEHAATRKQKRRPIGKNQAISHRLADMKLRIESARWLLYRACWLRDRGEEAISEVALAKLAISEGAIASSLDAVQIFGATGYSSESQVERMLRDAIPSTIFSGTSEIQRNLIALRLGL